MIEGIDLNCGQTPDAEALSLEANSGLTIFVGPNNCGKSALLEAIHHALAVKENRRNQPKKSALSKVRLSPFSDDLLEQHPSFKDRDDKSIVSLPSAGSMVKENWNGLLRSNWNLDHGKAFREIYCIWMNGSQRLSMLPDERGASLNSPVGPLAKLFVDNDRRAVFQAAVYEGIGHYPVIDSVSVYGTMKLAFSKKKPDSVAERSLSEDFVSYIENSIPAEQASDGFNAYVGMLGALFSSDYKAILIDEPEAFLHPALARTLGKQIAKERLKNLAC